MAPYKVFLANEIVAQLRVCKRDERQLITRLFDELADDPFRVGDFIERDNLGREIQVMIVGRYALYFWSDHAVKEVKIIGMKITGH
jgi:hypothetical protein